MTFISRLPLSVPKSRFSSVCSPSPQIARLHTHSLSVAFLHTSLSSILPTFHQPLFLTRFHLISPAKHGRRILNLLDDTPLVPGDVRPAYDNEPAGRQVLTDAELDLREWTPRLEAVPTSVDGIRRDLMPVEDDKAGTMTTATDDASQVGFSQGQGAHLQGATVGDGSNGGGGTSAATTTATAA